MSQADEDRLAELRKLTNALADNGDTEAAQQVAELGRELEQQIKEQGK